MRTFLVTTALLLAAASPVSAKLPVRIYIQVAAETEEDKDKVRRSLREALEARLNSTERYFIATDPLTIVLHLNVTCILLQSDSGTKGIACDSQVTYYPFKESPLSTSVEHAESVVAAGPDNTTFVAETLMNHFINGTTDTELAEGKEFVRRSVRLLCASHPEECKAPAK